MKNSCSLSWYLHNTCLDYESISVLRFKRLLQKSKKIFEDFLWTNKKGLKLPARVQHIEFHMTLCGNSRIKSLNKKFRHKDKITDVLSFPLYENLRQKSEVKKLWSEIALGDIFISIPVARRQAKNFDLPLECEIMYLFIHGFLHLLGFDHEKSLKEEKLMENLEDLIFSKILKTYTKSKVKK